MSHSTHVGFREPLTADLGVEESPVSAASVRLIPAWALLLGPLRFPPPVESCAVGVGHRFTATSSRHFGSPSKTSSLLTPFVIETLGVGHRFTATFSGSEFLSHCDGPASFSASCTVGVGHISAGGGQLTCSRKVECVVRPCRFDSCWCFKASGLRTGSESITLGVNHLSAGGDDEDPVPEVRGTNGGCG